MKERQIQREREQKKREKERKKERRREREKEIKKRDNKPTSWLVEMTTSQKAKRPKGQNRDRERDK